MIERQKLSQTVIAQLCTDIRRGLWTAHLPSERDLAGHYKVSRRVIRESILYLGKRGILHLRPRQPTEIVRNAINGVSPHPLSLVLLTPFSFDQADPEILRLLQVFFDLAHSQHASCRVICGERYYNPNSRELERLLAEEKADAWIIYRPRRAMQEFLARRNAPVVLFGTSDEQYNLPCVDVDRYALCYHAAGRFLRAGLKRLCLFRPEPSIGGIGDRLSEEGLRRGLQQSKVGFEPEIILYRDDPDALRRTVERFSRSIHGPVGLLATRVRPSLMLVSHLLKLGFDLTQQVPVMTCDWTPLFSYMSPSVAGYAADYCKLGEYLAKAALAIARNEPLRNRRQLIMPEFRPGSTFDRTLAFHTN